MAQEIGLGGLYDLSAYNFGQQSFAEITQTSSGLRTLGGFAVNPNGLVYYNGDASIKILTSPYLRIVMNDGSNDRLLIGDDGT